MKTKLGIIIIILLTGLIIISMQPVLVYAGPETPHGNLWDPFVNTNPFFGGTKLPGTLTIIYNPGYLLNYYPTACSNGMPQANMFYSVRFIHNRVIYTYEGSTGVCFGDIGTPGTGGQGDVIMSFLDYVVRQTIPTATKWNIKSITNPGISSDSLSFVTDIVVMVK
jgi:hypothetical protein